MRWRRTFYAVALLAAQATAAAAADMPGTALPPPAPQWVPPQMIVLNTGWYLRGDLGYAWGLLDGADVAPGNIGPYDSTLGNAMTGGLGVGIKSKWLRTDVTFDYLAPLELYRRDLRPRRRGRQDFRAQRAVQRLSRSRHLVRRDPLYRRRRRRRLSARHRLCQHRARRFPATRTTSGISPGPPWRAWPIRWRTISRSMSATATSISAT